MGLHFEILALVAEGDQLKEPFYIPLDIVAPLPENMEDHWFMKWLNDEDLHMNVEMEDGRLKLTFEPLVSV